MPTEKTSLPRTRFECLEPILNVSNLPASVAYYVDVLGFREADWGYGTFTHVSRDGVGIYLSGEGQGNPGAWVWVGVEDVSALYAEYRASGAKIVMEPTHFIWALEIRVEDPDGNVLRFGSDPLPDVR